MSDALYPARAVIRGPYFHDLMMQPKALQDTLNALPVDTAGSWAPGALKERGLRRVVLTGMGSSHFALYPLYLRLASGGLPVLHVETAEMLLGFESWHASDTLLVAVSQSGESAEVVRLLDRGGRFGEILGVTNRPESTLARASAQGLFLAAGEESTVSCKTYLATLAALHWLGCCLLEENPDSAIHDMGGLLPWMVDYLSAWPDHVADLTARLEGVRDLFITGRGPSLATAWTGGLILKESTRRHAEGMSCPAFRHGPLEMAGDSLFLLAFAGGEHTADLNRRLVNDVRKAGGRAAFAGPEGATAPVFALPGLAPALVPLAEMLPVQMMSLALAALDGREAGKFEHASKVTSTE